MKRLPQTNTFEKSINASSPLTIDSSSNKKAILIDRTFKPYLKVT